ncbi:19042_t:CDS:2 [Dentiscutata erythropus]|uniref:19042_t:CDS:1 n=1 Tax=Dentiscutata erythropus TaxID=1348616 RepID=A0A9N9IAQ7_9GLOM|nr:19042_t:CDS:2 [Dentiscutata erythropus]
MSTIESYFTKKNSTKFNIKNASHEELDDELYILFISNRREPGDGGVDYFGGFRKFTILVKNYGRPGSIGPKFVRELEGVMSRYHST